MKFRNRAAAPEHLRTKTELRFQRMKLGRGQRAAAFYWQGHTYVTLYDPAEAVPMRPRRAPSPSQVAALAAGRSLVGTIACKGCGDRADKFAIDEQGLCNDCASKLERERREEDRRLLRAEASRLLEQSPLILDTETTGLDHDDQVIEIAILDIHGQVLFHSLVCPSVPVTEGARFVHGISDAELATAPDWPTVYPVISALLQGRNVVAHNASFDARLLAQTCAAHDLPQIQVAEYWCTLDVLTDANGGRWPRLRRAMEISGAALPESGNAHRAVFDAECRRRIVIALAGSFESNNSGIRI